MFYPDTPVDELMPDVLINAIDKLVGSEFINRIGHFAKSANSFRNSDFMMSHNKQFETTSLEQPCQCTKGNLPSNVINHISISYSYRGGNVMLNGLDDSMEVNNGSWRP